MKLKKAIGELLWPEIKVPIFLQRSRVASIAYVVLRSFLQIMLDVLLFIPLMIGAAGEILTWFSGGDGGSDSWW